MREGWAVNAWINLNECHNCHFRNKSAIQKIIEKKYNFEIMYQNTHKGSVNILCFFSAQKSSSKKTYSKKCPTKQINFFEPVNCDTAFLSCQTSPQSKLPPKKELKKCSKYMLLKRGFPLKDVLPKNTIRDIGHISCCLSNLFVCVCVCEGGAA